MSLLLVAQGCALQIERSPKTLSSSGLIATPASQYSTAKGRSLGYRYKENLERLVEKIIRNPRTAKLQFANNIASVGGIGFFTHSGVTVPDDRFLEVVLGTGETFETNGDHNTKIGQVFKLYGKELLAILSSDLEMFSDKEVAGYGLNFTWRTLNRAGSGSRIGTERAIAYFPKERVRVFLKDGLSESQLLSEAVIFAVLENGPVHPVSFRAPAQQPDFRPPIQEQVLLPAPIKTDSEKSSLASLKPIQPLKEKEDLEAKVEEEHPVVMQKEGVKQVEDEVWPIIDIQAPLHAAATPQQITESADSHMRSDHKTTEVATAVQSGQAVSKETSLTETGKLQSSVSEDSLVNNEKATAARDLAVENSDYADETPVGMEPTGNGASAAEQGAGSTELEMRLQEEAIPSGTVETLQSGSPMSEKTRFSKDDPSPSMGDHDGRAVVASEKDGATEDRVPSTAPMTEPDPMYERHAQPGSWPSVLGSSGDPSQVSPLPSIVSTVAAQPSVDAKEPELPLETVDPVPIIPLPEQVAQQEPTVEKLSDTVLPAEKTQAHPEFVDFPVALPRSVPTMSHVGTTGTNEQLALLRERSADKRVTNTPLVRPLPKSLEGYVIQVAFSDHSDAQRWADNFLQRGYAVSVTEAGTGGALRLRIGNFRLRDDAERQLRSLKQDGLSGIILNLPQVYRPEVRSSLP